MKVESLEFEVHKMELEEPYRIAYDTISYSENITLKVITDKGIVGYGLAAPDLEITGESTEDVLDSINNVISPLIVGESPFRINYYLDKLSQEKSVKSSARAMLDIALYDILAKKAGLPLYLALGGYKNSIKTSVTIGIKPLAETLEIARKYWSAGFDILKLKGGLSIDEDLEKVFKLREIYGSGLTLRFDANQGYSAQQALEFINKAKKAEIEIFEQPTNYTNLEAMQTVTQESHVPVMGDESIRSLKDAMHFARQDAIDMISIKLQKVGGILESTHINSVAKSNKLDVMVSCLDECTLGIAAGLHFALSKANLLYADLDGHLEMLDDPYKDLFTIENGKMIPNNKPGLGL